MPTSATTRTGAVNKGMLTFLTWAFAVGSSHLVVGGSTPHPSPVCKHTSESACQELGMFSGPLRFTWTPWPCHARNDIQSDANEFMVSSAWNTNQTLARWDQAEA